MNQNTDLLGQFNAYFERFQPMFGAVYNCDIEEILMAARSDEKFAYPLLHVDIPTIRTQDHANGAFARYRASGVVMVKTDSYQTREQVWRVAMLLVQQVLNQFSEDSHEKEDVIDFNYGEVEIEAVKPLWGDDALGWEFKFSLLMPALSLA
ncbi:hypothetical protein BWI93_10250 [Siphonobacter sp. BAB-5385]|uniref:hypothetical protein n=1 Tax=Siphonobacter sp. BAB-5385 TaxID=1864822 RepID=UPI000B9E7316|nr:hypothetical protein [Siphonobacter sp. BAB-5385]OZI08239.1 hypothetical protein BWI93_10250 [Siphonobacter sp. BAB-5385]